MANTISSIKRMRVEKRRTQMNKARKSKLRYQIRAMRRLITAKQAKEALEALPKTYSVIDRAAKIGIIKKNTAARYKSRLTARVKALAA